MGGLWSFLLERFSLTPKSGGHRGSVWESLCLEGRTKDSRILEGSSVGTRFRRGTQSQGRKSERSGMRHSPSLLLPKFGSDCLGARGASGGCAWAR